MTFGPRSRPTMFQSSPTSKGGRYRDDWPNLIQDDEFQSSPTSKGGRYCLEAAVKAGVNLVSILAHLERWALH